MGAAQSWRQTDLFGPSEMRVEREPMPVEFVERIRNELIGTLARARAAETMPWRDLTATTLAELRFHSIAGWLPSKEAEAMRDSFKIEMARLYEIAAAAAEAE
jgi:hypothetical protein